jgi:hypothetical protein
MSPLDPQIPPAGEEIHLPEGSIQPFLLAGFLAIGLVGLTTWWELWVIGAIGVVWVIVRWIVDARREFSSLPLDHRSDGH